MVISLMPMITTEKPSVCGRRLPPQRRAFETGFHRVRQHPHPEAAGTLAIITARGNVIILLSELIRMGVEALQMQGAGLHAVNPTSFWQAHLKRFFWAHLALIIHIRHIPPFGMGYLTLCCQSVATLAKSL